jgi:hypothetical protein
VRFRRAGAAPRPSARWPALPWAGGLWWAPALALAVLVVTGPAAPARAEVIELTTGERITGTVKGATPRGLVVVVGGKQRTIPHRLIAGIEFSPPAGARATPPPGEPAPDSPAAGQAPEPPAATRRVRQVGSPRAAPDLAALAPPTLREAMQAVLALRASTALGPSLPDYTARIQAAKVQVDRYVADSSDGRVAVKQALASAMRFYATAASAWRTFDARGDFAALARDPAIVACPHLRETIEHDAARWSFDAADPAFVGLMAGTEGVEDLWACASDKLDEAQDLLAPGKPAAAR